MSKPESTPVDDEPSAVEPTDELAADEERPQEELQQAQNQALRAQAELENVRRRMRREMDEQRRFATQPLLSDLLPVIDNLERAIEAAQQNDSASGLLEGVKMVSTQLQDVLRRHHCPRIETAGVSFDPNLHEAVSQQPSEEHPPGTVIHETLPGYRLHDRVIRHSQVIVSAPS